MCSTSLPAFLIPTLYTTTSQHGRSIAGEDSVQIFSSTLWPIRRTDNQAIKIHVSYRFLPFSSGDLPSHSNWSSLTYVQVFFLKVRLQDVRIIAQIPCRYENPKHGLSGMESHKNLHELQDMPPNVMITSLSRHIPADRLNCEFGCDGYEDSFVMLMSAWMRVKRSVATVATDKA